MWSEGSTRQVGLRSLKTWYLIQFRCASAHVELYHYCITMMATEVEGRSGSALSREALWYSQKQTQPWPLAQLQNDWTPMRIRPQLQLTPITYSQFRLSNLKQKNEAFYRNRSFASFSPYLHIWSVATSKNQYHCYAWWLGLSEIQYHIKHLLLSFLTKSQDSTLFTQCTSLSLKTPWIFLHGPCRQDTFGKQDVLLGLGLTVAV